VEANEFSALGKTVRLSSRYIRLLITVMLVLCPIAALYVVSSYVLLGGFNQVEVEATEQNVGRGLDALSSEFDYLKNTSSDWANWDDPYEFMVDRNPEFVQSNLTDQALGDLGLDLILLVDAAGGLAAGNAYDLDRSTGAPLPEFLQHLSTRDSLVQPAVTGQVQMGFFLSPEGPLLLISRPILTSMSEGPAHGALIMGKYFDASLAEQLSQKIHARLSVVRLDAELPADFQAARDLLSGGDPIAVHPIDEQSIAGYTFLRGEGGAPVMILRIQSDRPVHAQAELTMRYISAALLVIGLLFGGVARLLLDRVIKEERFSLAVRGSNEGLWDWDIKTGEVYYSPRWKSLLGYGPNELAPRPGEWLDRIHPEDRRRVEHEIANHLQGLASDLQSEHRLQRKDGGYLWVLCRGIALRHRNGAAYRMAGSLSDITARKLAEQQLLHDAFHDALTNLPNRALFLDRLGRALARAKRSPRLQHAVVYLDLDRFKSVNDSFGHLTGDEMLVDCANRILLSVRATDTVARLGGDEFIVLLEDIRGLEEATEIAERICGGLSLPFETDSRRLHTSASLGIVLVGADYELPEQILRDADIALYRAKSLGRGQYQVFRPAMREDAVASLELENDLRNAVERNQFEMHYQPIISLRDGRIAKFEALVRWRHPTRGLVTPLGFISVAEDSGLILPLENWVLSAVCRQLHEWNKEFSTLAPFAASINLSAKQFSQPDLPDRIARVLDEQGLSPQALSLEITESVLMQEGPAAITILSRLKQMGIEVELDDFGTGYSSFYYLQQLPLDSLKIDRSFVDHIGARVNRNGTGSEIVQTIISLAHQLGLEVVAEGVETLEQLRRLCELECQFAQGFLIAEPLSSQRVHRLIAESRLVLHPEWFRAGNSRNGHRRN